jgi:hypothetical protein
MIGGRLKRTRILVMRDKRGLKCNQFYPPPIREPAYILPDFSELKAQSATCLRTQNPKKLGAYLF